MKDLEDIEIQEEEIRNKVYIVLIPIAILLIILGIYQSNSLDINEKKYLQSRELEFHGLIIQKRQDGDYTRANRYILLDCYHEEMVNNDIYKIISVGDSVYKKRGSDSLFFRLKNGHVITKDYNKYLRDKYNKLLNKK
jgi:hypothetical protein